jgi:hypothetical protein
MPYRLELLPVIPPFHIRARMDALETGQLVYYGPMPTYYGIGEIIKQEERYVVVDFRGTGLFAIHQELLAPEYLIPIPAHSLALL